MFLGKSKTQWSEVLSSRRGALGQPLATRVGSNPLENPLNIFLALLLVVFILIYSLDSPPPRHGLSAGAGTGKGFQSLRQNVTSIVVATSSPPAATSSIQSSSSSVAVMQDVYQCPPGASKLGCELCRINKEEGYVRDKDTQGNVKSQTQAAFDNIYKKKIWGEGGLGSGVGSTVENAEGATYALRMILYKYAITRLMDAPCGALAWTESFVRSMRKEIPCFTYVGVDIVRSVVEDNKKLFPTEPYVSFFVRDISDPNQPLPAGQHLILSRDALQHLSMPLIRSSIRSYCASNATYLLVGSYISAKKNKNKNIQTGYAFSINLLAPPFEFPAPLEIYNERTRDGKYLLLYRLHPDLCSSSTVVNFMNGNDNDSGGI